MVTSDAGAARDLLLGAVAADPDLLWARLELAGWYGERGLFEEAHGLLDEADGVFLILCKNWKSISAFYARLREAEFFGSNQRR